MLAQSALFYPTLHLDAVVGDAGFGYEAFLHTIYQLQARRVVALRAHETDKDKCQWPVRGYDDRGRPVCPFGYTFTSNGFDAEHRRHKWFCGQACLHDTQPRVRVDGGTYPPPECGYQTVEHASGKVLNVAERFPDGSLRLVRDVAVGFTTWKDLYRRA